uniref:Uncharacterized protein n=1 Tax=Sinorhizobium fredii (strain HH103) TaxID=1117943 RepID=A0A0A8WGX0_SINF1|nr:hypothetical protein [Sinorhizobium fredii HH103]
MQLPAISVEPRFIQFVVFGILVITEENRTLWHARLTTLQRPV